MINSYLKLPEGSLPIDSSLPIKIPAGWPPSEMFGFRSPRICNCFMIFLDSTVHQASFSICLRCIKSPVNAHVPSCIFICGSPFPQFWWFNPLVFPPLITMTHDSSIAITMNPPESLYTRWPTLETRTFRPPKGPWAPPCPRLFSSHLGAFEPCQRGAVLGCGRASFSVGGMEERPGPGIHCAKLQCEAP